MKGLLTTVAAVLAVLALGGMKWWQGKPLDGGFRAHLTLGTACSRRTSATKICERLESRPLQIVLNNGRGTTPILTANTNGDVAVPLSPGDYQVSFSIGDDSGSITNLGDGLIHVGSGRTVNVGTVHPPADVLQVAVAMQSVTQP